MSKAGRKRREGVRRYPKSGAIVRADRGERPDKIIATALAQPHRRGNQSPMAGYAFGRLFLEGTIDQRQFDAAETFTRRAVRYHALCVNGLPRFPSVLANMMKLDLEQQREQERIFKPTDFSIRNAPQTEEDRAAQAKSDYAELQDALAEAGMLYDGNTVLMRVCVMDRDIHTVPEVGAFRCALNAIANRLRM